MIRRNALPIAAVTGAVAALVLLGVLYGMNTKDAETEATETTETTTTKEIPDGPYAEELRELTEGMDLSGYHGDNWVVSLVIGGDNGSNEGFIRVKAPQGVLVLHPARRCDVDVNLAALAKPGDLIVWETLGDDLELCDDEVYVVALEEEL